MSAQPVRVLHALAALDPGGVETWLVNVLQQTDPARVQTDFLVHTLARGAYDDRVRALGGRILPCLHPGQPWRYAHTLRRILRRNGPYQVVHSHLHHYSGWVLRTARQEGVPIRIAHSHLDTTALDDRAGTLRRLYLAAMRRWIARDATIGIGASRLAARALFGAAWQDDVRNRIVYCGIDAAPFAAADGAPVRGGGIAGAAGDFVLGHVGRFVDQKNHAFLLEITAAVLAREPGTRLLLVGDGPLRAQVAAQAARMQLGDRVTFAGVRADVACLLRQMDVFVMPSRFEGLPLAGLEAQAAGLPLVISDQVTQELDFLPAQVCRLSLAQPASVWADAILAARARKSAASAREAIAALTRSPFDIRASARSLEAIYCQS